MSETKFPKNEYVVDVGNYHVIGFDMDHTLVRYKLPAVRKLVRQCIFDYLVKAKVLKRSDEECVLRYDHLVTKGLVVDKVHGNLLKLDSDGGVLMAYHGNHQLTPCEIDLEYGKGSKIESLQNSLLAGDRPDDYFLFDTYFDCPVDSVIAVLVEDVDRKSGKKWVAGQKNTTDYTEAWKQLYAGFTHAFRVDAFKDGTGGFFSSMLATPEKYIRRVTPGCHRWIQALRESGHLLFILTSSHADFAEFLLDYSYGKSWRSDFAYVGANARKPGFFAQPPSARPFYHVENYRESSCCPVADLKEGAVYVQGNCAGLTSYFSRLTGVPSPKIAYFGDSLRSDVLCLSKGGWDPVAIVEELFVEKPNNVPVQTRIDTTNGRSVSQQQNGQSSNLSSPAAKRRKLDTSDSDQAEDMDYDGEVLRSDIWGSFFTHTIHGEGGEARVVDTLCAHFLSKYAMTCIPCLPELAPVPVNDVY